MQELYLRLGQGTPLTYAQEDLNFKRIKAAIDSLETAVAGGGNGTVTNVGTGYGLSGGPITSTGTIIVDSATLSTK